MTDPDDAAWQLRRLLDNSAHGRGEESAVQRVVVRDGVLVVETRDVGATRRVLRALLVALGWPEDVVPDEGARFNGYPTRVVDAGALERFERRRD